MKPLSEVVQEFQESWLTKAKKMGCPRDQMDAFAIGAAYIGGPLAGALMEAIEQRNDLLDLLDSKGTRMPSQVEKWDEEIRSLLNK